jgi:hypothetical protein
MIGNQAARNLFQIQRNKIKARRNKIKARTKHVFFYETSLFNGLGPPALRNVFFLPR